eukprot:11194245-Lingulodinium_polyedra.AAC.1
MIRLATITTTIIIILILIIIAANAAKHRAEFLFRPIQRPSLSTQRTRDTAADTHGKCLRSG